MTLWVAGLTASYVITTILMGLSIVILIRGLRDMVDRDEEYERKINDLLSNMSKLEDQLDQLKAYYEAEEVAHHEGNIH